MLHSFTLSLVRFAFSFTVTHVIVSITPVVSFTLQVWFRALFKFTFFVGVLGATDSYLGVIGSHFGCYWFMFSIRVWVSLVRVLGGTGSRFGWHWFVFWWPLVHVWVSLVRFRFHSHWYVMCCSPLFFFAFTVFVVSFTPLLHSLILVDFIWVYLRSLVLPPLSRRGIFLYL